ncbi:MAG: MgtC/SapB family protein [Pirellulales bacterium]|nr:MgtC/SapB family protein [Pirellulales bacterium]
MPPTAESFGQLGISLLLGLLVGLQREHAAAAVGLRTFPLITVLGTVSAMLGGAFGGWVVAAGMLGIGVVLVAARSTRLRRDDELPGTTTDAAVLLMYAVGALLVVAPLSVGIAVGGGVAVLLQFKPELHRAARTLGDRDLKAIMQFVLITCIILPVLPHRTFGPLDVFNPFQTWLMVVLIVGMSLGGYIVYKFFGHNAGILLGGLLGGAISSTATTVSYSRQARAGQITSAGAAIVILIASTVVFGRVLVEIAVVSPPFLAAAAGPVLIMLALTALPSLVVWYHVRREPAPVMPEQDNPTQLKSAVFFAAMYALVLFALAAAERFVGQQGLYAVAALSGLTDMDAITLSAARMVGAGDVHAADGWRLIVIAGMANLTFKAAVVGVAAHRRLLGRILLLFSLPMLGGALLLAFWPG